MLESEETFGSGRVTSMAGGYYASPIHPHSNAQFMKPVANMAAPTPYIHPPPYGYAENQFSGGRMPLVPVNQYGVPQYAQVPDPRVMGYASPMHPGMYSLPPPPHAGMYSMPAAPPFQSDQYSPDFLHRRKAHRSQPAFRRPSLSDSSDSDEAQEISDRIMRSSDDPRELRAIMKSASRRTAEPRKKPTRKSYSAEPQKKSSRRNRTLEPPMRKSKNQRHKRDLSAETRPRKSTRDTSVGSVDGLAVVYADGEIPAARFDDWFQEEEREVVRPKKEKHIIKKDKKDTTVAIPAPRRRRAPQICNDKQTVWWNATSTGKRQRLPPADWRKGERYISAPDGTKVGLTGWKEVVCEELGWKSGTKKCRRSAMSTADEEEETRVRSKTEKVHEKRVQPKKDKQVTKKQSRVSLSSERSSRLSRASSRISDVEAPMEEHAMIEDHDFFETFDSSSHVEAVEHSGVVEAVPAVLPASPGTAIVPATSEAAPSFSVPLQAFDFMKKNKAGVYCLGSFKLLHRRGDRKWNEHDAESGFTTCPSISTKDITFAEVALDPNMPYGKMETLDMDTSIVFRVIKAAPNSIRIQIGKDEARLNEEDELRIHPGSSYSLTNLSKEKTAVLSMVIGH